MKKVTIVTIVMFVAAVFAASAQESTEIGAWTLYATEDVMTGETDYMLANEAEAHSGTLRTPAIIVQPVVDGIVVFVHWGGYSLDRDLRTIALMADGERSTVTVDGSTSREAAFMREDFMKAMPYYTTVAMQTEAATGREMVARWDFTGYTEALDVLLSKE